MACPRLCASREPNRVAPRIRASASAAMSAAVPSALSVFVQSSSRTRIDEQDLVFEDRETHCDVADGVSCGPPAWQSPLPLPATVLSMLPKEVPAARDRRSELHVSGGRRAAAPAACRDGASIIKRVRSGASASCSITLQEAAILRCSIEDRMRARLDCC